MIIKSEQDEDGIIRHTISAPVDGMDDRVVEYSAVMGGLSWPNEHAPGYYIIMGQSRFDDDYRSVVKIKPSLTFLEEFESSSLSKLVNRLTDDAKMLLCDEFYCDMEGDLEGFAESFWTYSNGAKGINLVQAPFTHNFMYGTQRVSERIGENSITMPVKGIIREQIERMEVKDLQNKPESHFHAVNALRYLVCGVEKFSPGPVPPEIMARILRDTGPRPGGFMAT